MLHIIVRYTVTKKGASVSLHPQRRDSGGAVQGAAGSAPGFDPGQLAALQTAWLKWFEARLQANELPLSGNVEQWIRTWGEAVSQVGLLNVNLAGSGNPQLERKIGSHFSYGRQLGRVLNVLTPLLDANKKLFDGQKEKAALREFEDMVGQIAALKRPSVDDIVCQVEAWRESPGFHQDLAELIRQLQALSTPQ